MGFFEIIFEEKKYEEEEMLENGLLVRVKEVVITTGFAVANVSLKDSRNNVLGFRKNFRRNEKKQICQYPKHHLS